MISIECHRSGERCPGKREFDNRIEINRVRSGEIDVAIPFNFIQSFEETILYFLGLQALCIGRKHQVLCSGRNGTPWDTLSHFSPDHFFMKMTDNTFHIKIDVLKQFRVSS